MNGGQAAPCADQNTAKVQHPDAQASGEHFPFVSGPKFSVGPCTAGMLVSSVFKGQTKAAAAISLLLAPLLLLLLRLLQYHYRYHYLHCHRHHRQRHHHHCQ